MATYYWVSRGTGQSTSWLDPQNWSNTSGGARGFGPPTSADDAVVDGNSFIISTLPNVNIASPGNVCRNFTINGVTVGMTFVLSSTITVSGNLFIQGTNVTRTGNGTWAFDGSGSHTFDFGSQTYNSVIFQGTGTYTLQSNYTQQSGGFFVIHSNGTLNLNGFTVTCNNYQSVGTNTRTLDQNGGTVNVIGENATVVNMTSTGFGYSGTRPVFNLTANASSGTRTINIDLGTISQAIDINVTAGTDTFAIATGDMVYNLNFTGFAGTWSSTTRTIFGNLTVSGGMTVGSGATATTFAATSGTQLITSAGKTFDFPITQNGVGGTVQLQDNLTMGSTRTFTLTNGTLDLSSGNRTLSCGAFSSNNSNIRVIAFGTGNITLTNNAATVWTTATATNFSYTGTPTVNATYSGSVGTRTIGSGTTGTITEANALSFNITAGSDTITITTNHALRSLNFTGFTGTFTSANRTFYGSLTLGAGMTATDGTGVYTFASTLVQQNITSNGVTFGGPITCSGTQTVQLQDNLTMGSTRTFTLTNGTLDLSSGNRTLSCGVFSSTNTNTRSIAFGTGNITLTGNATTIWTTNSPTNFSYTGTPTVNCTYSGSTGTRNIISNVSGGTEAQALNFNISAGSDIIGNAISAQFKNLNFTGFTGTLSVFARIIYGNLTVSGGMTLVAGTGVTTFAATSGTQQITTNGNTLDFPVTQDGVGGTVQLQDNLTMGSTRAYTLTNGTLDLSSGNRTLSCGVFSSNNSNTRSILFGTGNITVTGNDATVWNTAAAANFSYTGTSNVNFTYAGSTGTRTIAQAAAINGGTEANVLNMNISAGSDTVTFGGSGRIYRNTNFTGFTGTYANAQIIFVGNLIFSSGMTVGGGALGITFAATSGTQQITTNGQTLDFPITQNGVGGTVAFQDALTQGSTRAFTIVNGTVRLQASTTNVVGSLVILGTATKALQSTIPGTQATISQTSGDVYADEITITDSNATGGANFYATAASNGGNNTGWNFANNFYYWVGGDGNWSDAAAHWSDSSGGSPSAAYLPTASDIVFFDSNSNSGTSAFSVTVNGTTVSPSLCNDFVCGLGVGDALDGAMTLDFATGRLDVHGSLTFPATNFSTTSAGSPSQIRFSATTTGKTITTNGVSFPNLAIIFDGAGGEWTLGSAFTVSASNRGFFVRNGTFNSGNYNITGGTLFVDTVGTQTINLGSSTYTVGGAGAGVTFTQTAGLTFNAGTSTIVSQGGNPTFTGGGQTFYNVSFTSAANGTTIINGANTFNDLNQTSRSATGVRIIRFGANQTVSGTLTLGVANTSIRRIQVQSDTIGTQRTITLNGSLATLADVDFRDIATAGSAGTWTGTRIGNGLGNSGITFDAAKTVYWNFAAGGGLPLTAWALSSGGAVNSANFPLAQDKIIIEDTGLNSGATINTANAAYWFGEIDISTRTLPMTLANGTLSYIVYKNVTLSSAVTMTGTAAWQFLGQGTTQILDVNTATFVPPITIDSPGGTLQLAENTACSATVTLTGGTLDLNDFDLTCNIFSSTNSNTRVIAFGTGEINLTGNDATIWGLLNITGFSYTGTPTVNLTYAGSTGTRIINNGGSVGGTESTAVSFNISAGSDTINFSSSVTNAIKNLNFTGFTGILNNTLRSIYGNLIISSGMTNTATTQATTFAATSGTQQITTNGVTIDFPMNQNGVGGTVQLQDNLTMGSTRTYTLTNGTLDLNDFDLTCALFSSTNTNTRVIAFGTGEITLTGDSAVIWDATILTNFSYTGTPTVNCTYSGSTGTRTISNGGTDGSESNAISFNVSAGSDIFTISSAALSSTKNLNFTGFAGTLSNNTNRIFGNLTLSSGMTLAGGTAPTTFAATSGTQQITTNGNTTIDFPINQSGVGGTVQLQDNLTTGSTRTYTLNNGTLNLNNRTLSTGTFNSNNANTRTIAFGTGNITVTGNDAIVWITSNSTNLTYTGTPTVNCTYSGSTGTRTINANNANGGTEANALNFNISSGSDTIDGGLLVKNLDFTGFTGTYSNTAIVHTIYGNLKFSSGMTLTSNSNFWLFAATSGTQQITSAGNTLDFPITQDGVGGTVQLQDNLTMGSTRTYTLTNGTLDLNDFDLTCGLFSSANTNTRVIAFGTGEINISGRNATVLNISSGTFSYTGTPTVKLTGAGTGGETRNIALPNATFTEATAIDLYVTAGADTVASTGVGTTVRKLDFTGFSGTFTRTLLAVQFGDLILSSGMTYSSTANMRLASTSIQQITTNGNTTIDFSLFQEGVGSTVQLQDNLTISSTRTYVLTNGTLDLNDFDLTCGLFSSANANTRVIAFGTGEIDVTGNDATVWNTAAATGFTYTGTPTVNATYSGSTGTRNINGGGSALGGTESNALNFNITSGSDIVQVGTALRTYKNINFTGFNGTLSNTNRIVYGNLILSSGMTLEAGGLETIFAATSGTQLVTTNGQTLDFPVTQDGVGGTVAFQDALTQGSTQAFTIVNGTVQLKNGVTTTVGSFLTSGTNQKFLQSTSPGSQATLSQASGVVNASYLTIQDSNATGGATFNAFTGSGSVLSSNNVNAGNNRGWNFTPTSSSFLIFF